jgi:hypothetical protein
MSMAFLKPGDTQLGKGGRVQTQVLFCDCGKWLQFTAHQYMPNLLTLRGAVILFKSESITQTLKQKLEVTLGSHEHNLLIPDSVLVRPRK